MSRKTASLTTRQMRELREAFDLFDQDHSGTISLSELKQILVTLNLKATDTLVRKLMKEMDTDGNGSIEFNEFVRVMADVYLRKFTDEEMRQAFKCFDTDNSGYITNDELHVVLSRLNPDISDQRVAEAINKIDLDKDGKISYQEFVHMLQNM